MAFRPFYVANAIQVGNFFSLNAAQISFGSNVTLTPTQLSIGNLTNSLVANQNGFFVNNGSNGVVISRDGVVTTGTAQVSPTGFYHGNSSSNAALSGSGLNFGPGSFYAPTSAN